jgi:hypothetical protein
MIMGARKSYVVWGDDGGGDCAVSLAYFVRLTDDEYATVRKVKDAEPSGKWFFEQTWDVEPISAFEDRKQDLYGAFQNYLDVCRYVEG